MSAFDIKFPSKVQKEIERRTKAQAKAMGYKPPKPPEQPKPHNPKKNGYVPYVAGAAGLGLLGLGAYGISRIGKGTPEDEAQGTMAAQQRQITPT